MRRHGVPAALSVLALAGVVVAVDNGLGLTPPLGWRSFNAFWGIIDQVKMETIMDAMVSRNRTVDGKPTSLLDLGYNRVGLDGGWNQCFKNNKSFHWKSDGRPVWIESAFPDPQSMVDKAHRLGLKPGWYMNNCGCNENNFEGEMVTKIMEGSVKAVVEMGWDGLKLDSCSQFNNLSWWNELINASGRPILLENCHQGGFAPGMIQWQSYVRNGSSYDHKLGYFSLGHDAVAPLHNSEHPRPTRRVKQCYVKNGTAHFQSADLSYSDHCTGAVTPSDCPYNLYRTSGDIGTYWDRVLSNLGSTVPFLNASAPLSRPGGWAYPDMLEVGRLHNFSESRTHFAAWSVMSSPLILSFDLRDAPVMDAMWPIISNRDIIAINQRWAGAPGNRLSYTGAVNGNVGNSSQIWSKPLGERSHAVLFMSTGPLPSEFALPYQNISTDFGTERLCIRNLYTKADMGPVDPTIATLNAIVQPHDSAYFCVRPASAGACHKFYGCPSFAS